ncbi:MAG TPA: hypothetical protein VIM84_03620 [Gemmatimonadales bacterium]
MTSTVTGYRAPRSTVLHRPLDTSHLSYFVERTYCGVDLTATWHNDATGSAYTCRHCETVHQRFLQITGEWQEGEEQIYTSTRHPGLAQFFTDAENDTHLWRLIGAPTVFQAAHDARGPQDRPMRLIAGAVDGVTVGYFPDLNAAIVFLRTVQAAGELNGLLQDVQATTWNPATDPPLILSTLLPKESSPA